jgi:hypothetical protein
MARPFPSIASATDSTAAGAAKGMILMVASISFGRRRL